VRELNGSSEQKSGLTPTDRKLQLVTATRHQIILYIHCSCFGIEKKSKTKVNEIYFSGNKALSNHKLRMAMKNTNAKFSLRKHI
ncbi:hypothetical protein CLI75_12060, partial [Porphyromonas gingivalis]